MTRKSGSPEEMHRSGCMGRRSFLKVALAAGPPLLIQRADKMLAYGKAPQRKGAQMQKGTVRSIAAMAAAAEAFIKSLTNEQQAKALLKADDESRFDWHFVPKPRKGIPFKELDPAQRRLANALFRGGLGEQGFTKASGVISLEPILKEIEKGSGPVRDPELYYVTLFGRPGDHAPWAWSLEGHHISMNYTVVNGEHLASTPSFLGANPAEVRHGERKGLRLLAKEEDLGRSLVKSLDDKQRAQAVVSESAPRDILSSNSRKADPVTPAGLQASRLGQKQADILNALLREYAANVAPEIAAARLDRLRAAGFDSIYFAWAGGLERGDPHYYRIQGPSFLIEYDNVQNNANHIHTVWRDFNGDFGLDLLAQHYKQGHR